MSVQPVSMDDAALDGSARHIVPLSGGKDSTALAVYLAMNYAHLPFEYVTADTGVELPETYEYFDRLEHVLGAEVKRVSAFDLFQVEEKAGRTAFDVALYEHFAGYLPSFRARWCTRILKIAPFEKYIGGDKAYSYIAIRGDENRSGYLGTSNKPVLMSEEPNILPVYPFKDDGITLGDVKRILEETGLGSPKYYEWRSRSGCYFCFYQQIGEWHGLKERHPDLFEKAKAYEVEKNGRRYTWVNGKSLDDIASMPKRAMKPKDDGQGCAICHL